MPEVETIAFEQLVSNVSELPSILSLDITYRSGECLSGFSNQVIKAIVLLLLK